MPVLAATSALQALSCHSAVVLLQNSPDLWIKASQHELCSMKAQRQSRSKHDGMRLLDTAGMACIATLTFIEGKAISRRNGYDHNINSCTTLALQGL